jgi:3-hydroxyisobutyrate dehydrogenase
MLGQEMQNVGIIGTGEIGWRMGKLLQAGGHHVIGYDIRAEALRRPKDSDFRIAGSIGELCHHADVVITCVTDGAALRAVVAAPAGVAECLPKGRILLDTTSAEPWITKELARLLAEKGILFLDAPVSGGVPAAEAGRLNFMVGGDAALVERCRPLLKRLGPVITHVGGIGTGHTIKAVNMLALAASMLATAELIGIGLRVGLELDTLVARLDAGAGASFSTRVHYPRFIAPGNYASGFTFDLMLKDLSIGIELADRLNVPLFLLRSAYEFYRVAANCGLRGKDNTRIVESLMALGRKSRTAERTDLIGRLERMAAFCGTVITGETLCLGGAAGLPVATVIEVLSASSGDSKALSQQVPAYLRGESDATVPTMSEVWSAAADTIADATAAIVPTPLLNQAVAIQAAAMAKTSSAADSRSVVDLISGWTGQRLALQ